jgi:hypothetical protein
LNNKNVFELPTESALSFHLRTRLLPAAVYLTAATVLLLLAKVIGA